MKHKTLQHMTQASAAAFEAWTDWAWKQAAAHERCGKVVRRMQSLRLAAAVQVWIEWAWKLAEMREQVVWRMQNQKIATMVRKWTDYAQKQSGVRDLCRRVVSRLLLRTAAMAFDCWFSAVDASLQQAAVLGRLVVRMKQLAVSSALGRWVEFAGSCKKARRCLAQAMLSGLSRSFEQWREHSSCVKHEAAAEAERQRKLQGIVGRWTLGQVSKCFAGWRAGHVQHRKLQRLLLRLRQGEIAGAFCGWRERVRDRRRQTSVAKRVLARLIKRALVQSFDGLVENVASCKRGRRAVLRLLHMRVGSVLETWSMWAVEQRSVRRRLDKIVSRLLLRAAAMAFDCWVSTVDASLQQAAVLGRVVVRMKQLAVSSALCRWVEFAGSCKKARRCLARALLSRLGQSFEQWRECSSALKMQRDRTLENVVSRWSGVSLKDVFDGWLGYVTECFEALAVIASAEEFIKNASIRCVVLPAQLRFCGGLQLQNN